MKMYGKLSDTELISLLKADDHTAFTEIYDRYQSLLYLYTYKKLQDKEEAKDIIQDVFITLWNSRQNFELQVTLTGYLYKAVLNKVLNSFRHKSITQQHIDSFKKIVVANLETADYLIREKEIASLIEREIQALPEKMREVFELRRKEYLSNKQIAERLQISEHTVATHMKKALKTLRLRIGLVAYLAFFFHW